MRELHVIEPPQVNISGLYLVLRLADRNHIADDVPHSIVSHIVAELQVQIPTTAPLLPCDLLTRVQNAIAAQLQTSMQQARSFSIASCRPHFAHSPPKLVRDSGRSNNGWTQWCARAPPSSHRTRQIICRFIERVTNNVEICVTDIHCRLECGGADFHTDESKAAWPNFAVGVRIERYNMGRVAPADAKNVTTSFGIGSPTVIIAVFLHFVTCCIRIRRPVIVFGPPHSPMFHL